MGCGGVDLGEWYRVVRDRKGEKWDVVGWIWVDGTGW